MFETNVNALDMLEADHRELLGLFKGYSMLERGRSADIAKATIGDALCALLAIHGEAERAILFPAARRTLADDDLMHDAESQYRATTVLIAKALAVKHAGPEYDRAVGLIGTAISEHVQSQEIDMFPRVRNSRIDLKALALRLGDCKFALAVEHKDIQAGIGRFDEVGDPVGREIRVRGAPQHRVMA